jgi:hypothetical protein
MKFISKRGPSGRIFKKFLKNFYFFPHIFFELIEWRTVLVVEEAGVPGENHRPWASNW